MKNESLNIQNMIYEIRGQRVMLDTDLATLYDVETFNLNKAVKRNMERFPSDFMFQLDKGEWENLTFQNGISSKQHGSDTGYLYIMNSNINFANGNPNQVQSITLPFSIPAVGYDKYIIPDAHGSLTFFANPVLRYLASIQVN
jgi:hypothetical protein